MNQPSLQLWTVRQSLAEDPLRAIARVRAAGFAAVELAPLSSDVTPRQMRNMLSSCSLAVTSIHCELPLGDAAARVAELCDAVHCRRIIWHGWPRDPRFDSSAGVRRIIDEYRQAHQTARDSGLEFGLHTHWWEFEPIDGQVPYRVFLDELPADLFFQLDVYWAQTAGRDPMQLIGELGARLKSLHLKDGPTIHGAPMTAFGEGNVNIRQIVQRVGTTVDWIVELDECATDPLEAAQRSLEFLHKSSIR